MNTPLERAVARLHGALAGFADSPWEHSTSSSWLEEAITSAQAAIDADGPNQAGSQLASAAASTAVAALLADAEDGSGETISAIAARIGTQAQERSAAPAPSPAALLGVLQKCRAAQGTDRVEALIAAAARAVAADAAQTS